MNNSKIHVCFFLLVCLTSVKIYVEGCKTSNWRNMTMEEILLKSEFVVYGKDISHGKLRNPEQLDARFTVYCVIKAGTFKVPGQLIIENIRNDDLCSGVDMQTEAGKEYIIGLVRTFNGYTKYAEINPLQKTAFLPSAKNLERIAATCDLDDWNPPKTGDQDKCPTPVKPWFCTKVRDPAVSSASIGEPKLLTFTILVLVTFFILMI